MSTMMEAALAHLRTEVAALEARCLGASICKVSRQASAGKCSGCMLTKVRNGDISPDAIGADTHTLKYLCTGGGTAGINFPASVKIQR